MSDGAVQVVEPFDVEQKWGGPSSHDVDRYLYIIFIVNSFLFFGHFANRKFGGIFILLLVSKVGRYPGRSFAFYHTTYLKQHLRTSSESYWVTK